MRHLFQASPEPLAIFFPISHSEQFLGCYDVVWFFQNILYLGENEQYQWYYDSFVNHFSDLDIVGNNNAAGYTETGVSEDDWYYTVINPTRQEFEEMGHQVQDFILDCRFNARQCKDR